MRLLATLGLITCAYSILALGMDDFVPAFLMPSGDANTQTESIPVKPLVDIPRNSSATKSWYCNRNPNSAGNVFCNKNTASTAIKSYTYESSATGDKTKVVDNSVTGTKFGQNTAANQETLQNQDLKNTLQKNQGGFMVPIAPSDNMNMNINQQQIQFNIKY